jgi:hypothetical protein
MKSRTARHCRDVARHVFTETDAARHVSTATIAFISSPRKTEYYRVTDEKVELIDFLDAATILKATKDEPAAPFKEVEEFHFAQVKRALGKFREESMVQQDTDSVNEKRKDKVSAEALKFLGTYMRRITDDAEIKQRCIALFTNIENGIYTQLTRTVRDLSRTYKSDENLMRKSQYEIDKEINDLYEKYYTIVENDTNIDNTEPNIVISETFI